MNNRQDPSIWMPIFLNALKEQPIVKYACDAAQISRSTAYRHRKQSEQFAEEWDDALEVGIDRLEQMAWAEAEGGDKTLLMFLLKAFRPSKFRDMRRNDFQPVEITVTRVDPVPPSPPALPSGEEY